MSDEENSTDQKPDFKIKKLSPFFIDEVSNISISPNGACRLQFVSWQTSEEGKPVRVDSEVIMTSQTMTLLADSLPKAMEQASSMLKQRSDASKASKSLQ